MTQTELATIERALGIQLPIDYRHWADSLSPPDDDSDSWKWFFSDSERLIEVNQNLRQVGCYAQFWPHHLFCIAEADGNYYFLDLQNPSSIYYTNHDAGPYYEYPDFTECFYQSAEDFYASP